MTSKVASWLVTLGQVFGGFGTLILTTDPSEVPFGWDARDVGLALMWGSQAATVLVVAIRNNLIPMWETGKANDGIR